MQLYSYFRSSAAYRVRIALHLKGIPFETVPVHLVRSGGEQRASAYLEKNPQGLLPALVDEGPVLAQSLAILEYLDEKYTNVLLVWGDAAQKAHIRAFALHIACEIHPLNNLRVLQYLTGTAGLSEDAKLAWYQHWISTGFSALEQLAQNHATNGPYCFGEQISLADVCLIPQIYNAERFKCDLQPFPRLQSISKACATLDAFVKAHPANQPDSE